MKNRVGVVFFACACLASTAAFPATGGPDAGGYRWADQAEPGINNSIPTPSGPAVPITLGNESVSSAVALGFTFPFYGTDYTQFVLSDNGWLSFNTAVTNPTPSPGRLPQAGAPDALVAWYWRDLEAPSIAEYRRFNGGGYVFLRTNVPGSSEIIQAYIVLYQSGSIKFYYQGVHLSDTASAGIENATGTIGLNPWYLGTGLDGFAINAETVLQFFPAAKLSCSAPTTIDCGQTIASSSPAALPVNTEYYTCNTTGTSAASASSGLQILGSPT